MSISTNNVSWTQTATHTIPHTSEADLDNLLHLIIKMNIVTNNESSRDKDTKTGNIHIWCCNVLKISSTKITRSSSLLSFFKILDAFSKVKHQSLTKKYSFESNNYWQMKIIYMWMDTNHDSPKFMTPKVYKTREKTIN